MFFLSILQQLKVPAETGKKKQCITWQKEKKRLGTGKSGGCVVTKGGVSRMDDGR
jgi:hypothetical protein